MHSCRCKALLPTSWALLRSIVLASDAGRVRTWFVVLPMANVTRMAGCTCVSAASAPAALVPLSEPLMLVTGSACSVCCEPGGK